MSCKHSSSLEATRSATPEISEWIFAPPRSSIETSSPVTSLMTDGPVMNIWLVPFTIMMKSVNAGEYAATPMHGPMIAEICGTVPDVMEF